MRHPILPFILVLSILAVPALAQDGHYWDNQYGTKGELLGGLVVGSPGDLSATYYNPGWISLRGDKSVLLTTRAVEAYTIKIKDGPGKGLDPSSTTVTTSPGYLAGRFSSSKGPGWQWAYSYLQKVKFDFDTDTIRILDEANPPPSAIQDFSGEALRQAQSNEYWYGITFSRRLGDNVGLGFSPYLAQRTMKSRFQVAAQALGSAQEFAQTYFVESYDFWNVRLLGKIGLAVDKGKLTYGLTVTTPSLNITGSGKAYSNTSYSGLDLDGSGTPDPPYLASNYQEDLKSYWKSPFSTALGITWRPGSTGLHATVEWFNSVPTSQVMDAASYDSQSNPGDIRNYNLDFGAKSVLNWGVGFDHVFNKKMAMYGAVRSDFSAIPEDIVGEIQLAVWDLWHLSGGASFTFLDIELTLGAEYSWGSDQASQFVNFDAMDLQGVIGDLGDAEVTYQRLKLLIGFNLPFGNNSGGPVPGT